MREKVVTIVVPK